MIKNYLVTSLRNMWRSKFYSLISLMGLAIGLTCCILVFVNVYDEFSFDRYHRNADRIQRVLREFSISRGRKELVPIVPSIIKTILKESFPEIQEVVCFQEVAGYEGGTLHSDNKFFPLPSSASVDPAVFRIFDMPLLEGDTSTALNQPDALVISERFAKKCFGSTRILGKTVAIETAKDTSFHTVTAVMRDFPRNSSIQYDILVNPRSRISKPSGFRGRQSDCQVYILLREGASRQHVMDRLNAIVKDPARNTGWTGSELQPLTDIHWNKKIIDIPPATDVKPIVIQCVIALLVLIVACINYVNFVLARATSRMKEIGIRKTVGAEQKQIISQFIIESAVLVFLALLLALVLAEAFSPLFGQLIEKNFDFSLTSDLGIPLGIALLWIFACIVSGMLPAFVISRFNPAQILRQQLLVRSSGDYTRKTLLVFQFSASFVLIVCTFVAFRQLSLLQSRDIGFDPENLIGISLRDSRTVGLGPVLRNAVLTIPGVQSASLINTMPCPAPIMLDFDYIGSRNGMISIGIGGNSGTAQVMYLCGDSSLQQTLGLKIVSEMPQSASDRVRANELVFLTEWGVKTMQRLGFSDMVGKQIELGGQLKTVAGVFKDINLAVVRGRPTRPDLIYITGEKDKGSSHFELAVKTDKAKQQQVIASIQDEWKKIIPGIPISLYQVSDVVQGWYRKEIQFLQMLTVVTTLAVVIACLGIFGLTAYSAERRTKEIGIRKMVGATSKDLLFLLAKDYLKLVILAIIIGIPIASYLMDKWLQNYSSRVGLSAEIFIFTSLGVIVIALIPVVYQSVKASFIDPAKSLRYE